MAETLNLNPTPTDNKSTEGVDDGIMNRYNTPPKEGEVSEVSPDAQAVQDNLQEQHDYAGLNSSLQQQAGVQPKTTEENPQEEVSEISPDAQAVQDNLQEQHDYAGLNSRLQQQAGVKPTTTEEATQEEVSEISPAAQAVQDNLQEQHDYAGLNSRLQQQAGVKPTITEETTQERDTNLIDQTVVEDYKKLQQENPEIVGDKYLTGDLYKEVYPTISLEQIPDDQKDSKTQELKEKLNEYNKYIIEMLSAEEAVDRLRYIYLKTNRDALQILLSEGEVRPDLVTKVLEKNDNLNLSQENDFWGYHRAIISIRKKLQTTQETTQERDTNLIDQTVVEDYKKLQQENPEVINDTYEKYFPTISLEHIPDDKKDLKVKELEDKLNEEQRELTHITDYGKEPNRRDFIRLKTSIYALQILLSEGEVRPDLVAKILEKNDSFDLERNPYDLDGYNSAINSIKSKAQIAPVSTPKPEDVDNRKGWEIFLNIQDDKDDSGGEEGEEPLTDPVIEGLNNISNLLTALLDETKNGRIEIDIENIVNDINLLTKGKGDTKIIYGDYVNVSGDKNFVGRDKIDGNKGIDRDAEQSRSINTDGEGQQGQNQSQQQTVTINTSQSGGEGEQRQSGDVNVEVNVDTDNIVQVLQSQLTVLEEMLENQNLSEERRNEIQTIIDNTKETIINITGNEGNININTEGEGNSQEAIQEAAEDFLEEELSDQDKKGLKDAGETEEGFMAAITKVFKNKGGWKQFISATAKRLGSSLAVSSVAAGSIALFGPVGATVVGAAMVGMGAVSLVGAVKKMKADAKESNTTVKDLWKDKEYRKGLLVGTLSSGAGRGATLLLAGTIPGIGGIAAATLIGAGIDTGVDVYAELDLQSKQRDLHEKYQGTHELRKYNELRRDGYIYEGTKNVNIDKILKELKEEDGQFKGTARKIGLATLLEIYNNSSDENKETYRYVNYTEDGEEKRLDLSQFAIQDTEQSTPEYPTLDFEPSIDKYLDVIDTEQLSALISQGWEQIDESQLDNVGLKIVQNYVGLESADIDQILSDERRIYLEKVTFLNGFRTASAVVNSLFVIGAGTVALRRGVEGIREQRQARAQQQEVSQEEVNNTREVIQDDDAEITRVLQNENGERVYEIDLNGDSSADMYKTESGEMFAVSNDGAAKIFELDNSLPPNTLSVQGMTNSTTGVTGTLVNSTTGEVMGVVVDGGNGALGSVSIDQLQSSLSAQVSGTGESANLQLIGLQPDGSATISIGGQNYETNIATLSDIPGTESISGTAGAGAVAIQHGDSMPTLLQRSIVDAMEHNPNLREVYQNDPHIMDRTARYQGNFHANDAQIRNEVGIRNPVTIEDGSFEYSRSPYLMSILERLNGGPINLPQGTPDVPGSPGYNLNLQGLDIDANLDGLTNIDVPTEVVTDVSDVSGAIGAGLLGLGLILDKDASRMTREASIEIDGKKVATSASKGGASSTTATTSDDDKKDKGEGEEREAAVSKDGGEEKGEKKEGEASEGEEVEETKKEDKEQEKPFEAFDKVIKNIVLKIRGLEGGEIAIGGMKYKSVGKEPPFWKSTNKKTQPLSVLTNTKKKYTDEELYMDYRRFSISDNFFITDIKMMLQQYQEDEKINIDGINYKKQVIDDETVWQSITPSHHSENARKARIEGTLNDGELAKKIRNLGKEAAKRNAEIKASAKAETAQSDAETEKKERKNKGRKILRTALVVAGVAGGIAATATGYAGAVLTGAIASGLASRVGDFIYKKRFSKFEDKLKNNNLTEDQIKEYTKKKDNSEKVIEFLKTFRHLTLPLVITSGVGAVLEPQILGAGVRVQVDTWLDGFINQYSILQERVPIP